MIRRIDHIAFAVKDLDRAIAHAEKYGAKHLFTSLVEKDGYEVAAVRLGECVFTFLRPVRENSFVQGFLNKKGEGLHHIGLEVENLRAYASALESEEITIPVKQLEGHGRIEVLVSPKDGFGHVLQLIEWETGADVSLEKRIARFVRYRT